MNYYTVYNLKADTDSNLHSGGVSQLANFYKTIDKGRRKMIGKVRPPELVRSTYLESAVFDNVDEYSVPDDLKYSDIINLKYLSAYRNVDSMDRPLELVYSRRFSQKRGGAANVMAIVYRNAVKFAKLFHARGKRECQWQIINYANSLTENGTWNTSGNVENLRLDELNHITKQASLSFDINNSSSTGSLYNFSMTPVDLYDFLQKGAAFAWLNFSIPKEVITVKLILGSNSADLTTDYYFATVDQPHNNIEFMEGWNLLRYMMRDLMRQGTPNPKSISYIRVEFTTTGNPIPNCNMDALVARQGGVYEVEYNSTYMFMDPNTRAIKKVPTSDSDLIIAEEDTYNLLMLETTLAAQKEIYGSAGAARSDVSDIEGDLNGVRTSRGIIIKQGLYSIYLREHKSEALEETDSIHVFGNEYDGYTDESLPGYPEGHNGSGYFDN